MAKGAKARDPGPHPGLLQCLLLFWARGLRWGSGLVMRAQGSLSFPVHNTETGDNSVMAQFLQPYDLPTVGWRGESWPSAQFQILFEDVPGGTVAAST